MIENSKISCLPEPARQNQNWILHYLEVLSTFKHRRVGLQVKYSGHLVARACDVNVKIRNSTQNSFMEVPAIRRKRKGRDNDLKMAMLRLKKGIPEKIVKEGSLFVQSKGLWRLPANFWKERYFVLNNDSLYFFKRGKECEGQSPKEVILLEGDDLGIYADEITSANGNKNFCLKLTKKRRSYTLCACSEAERNSWLTALLTVVTENKLSKCTQSISEETSFDHFSTSRSTEWKRHDLRSDTYCTDDFVTSWRNSSSQLISAPLPDENNNHGRLYKAFSMLNLSHSFSGQRRSCVLLV